MSLDDLLDRCQAHREAERIRLGPPVDESEIRRVWEPFGQPVSADVRRPNARFGGFQEYEHDDRFFWSLWPWVDRVGRNKQPTPAGVCSADHSIGVVRYALRYENPGQSSVWAADSADGARRVATDLEDSLTTYLEDPYRLL